MGENGTIGDQKRAKMPQVNESPEAAAATPLTTSNHNAQRHQVTHEAQAGEHAAVDQPSQAGNVTAERQPWLQGWEGS